MKKNYSDRTPEDYEKRLGKTFTVWRGSATGKTREVKVNTAAWVKERQK